MSNNAPMTTAEVGAVLGKSARTVQRMAESGELAYMKKLPGPNGSYLFDPAVVRRAARQQEKASATQ